MQELKEWVVSVVEAKAKNLERVHSLCMGTRKSWSCESFWTELKDGQHKIIVQSLTKSLQGMMCNFLWSSCLIKFKAENGYFAKVVK